MGKVAQRAVLEQLISQPAFRKKNNHADYQRKMEKRTETALSRFILWEVSRLVGGVYASGSILCQSPGLAPR
jgi:hypothetical protein